MTFVALAPTATNVPEYEAERPLGGLRACGLALGFPCQPYTDGAHRKGVTCGIDLVGPTNLVSVAWYLLVLALGCWAAGRLGGGLPPP
jgi:hypothetical protein